MLVTGPAIGAVRRFAGTGGALDTGMTFSDPASGKASESTARSPRRRCGWVAPRRGLTGTLVAWCLYVNVVLALVAVTARWAAGRTKPRSARCTWTRPARSSWSPGWSAWSTGCRRPRPRGGAHRPPSPLVAGLILLAAFVLVERRVRIRSLPLRIVLTRFRGGSDRHRPVRHRPFWVSGSSPTTCS